VLDTNFSLGSNYSVGWKIRLKGKFAQSGRPVPEEERWEKT
jgi:hypothetical protein